MKVNKTYRSLLDKSVASMIAAIEIYNKPNFSYREDSFAILCVNAWELILKAVWFKYNHYRQNSIYEMVPKKKKDGTNSKNKVPALNRVGNPKTLSIQKLIELLKSLGSIDTNLEANLWAFIELRDNAIHFINMESMSKQIQELGFASISNYINFIGNNNIDIDLSLYNFYLMPLAYVNSRMEMDGVLTEPMEKYKDFLLSYIEGEEKETDYQIAVSIDIKFNKSSSLHTIDVVSSTSGIPITLSEEDIRKRFPLSHKNVIDRCRCRYSDFKANAKFYDIMRRIKANPKFAYEKRLNKDNPKSPKTWLYNTNIWKEFNKEYTKK